MKKLLMAFARSIYGFISIFAVVCGLFLSSCGNDNDPAPSGGDDIVPDKEVNIYVYPGIEDSDGVTPRMTIVDGDELCTELYDPSQPEMYVFHCMNITTGLSAFMTASDKGVTIMEDNPFNPDAMSNMVLASKDGQEIVVSFGTFSKSDNTYNITSVKRMACASTPKAVKSRGDDMDFARELVMKDILNPLSTAINDMDSWLGEESTIGMGAKWVLEVWAGWGIPVAEAHLYSNNEEEFQKLLGEKVFTYHVKNNKYVKYVVDVLDDTNAAKQIYRGALSAYHHLSNYVIGNDEEYDDVSDEFILTTTDSYSFTSRRAQESVWKVYDDSKLYKPTVRLVGVKDRSASVRGNLSNYDGRFTVTGYYLYRDRREVDKISASLDGSVYTFSNLAKGGEYAVTSFATVMGVTYESDPVYFRIDGDLELSHSELTFSDAGGKVDVQVTLPSDKWTWNAGSQDNWCKVTLSENNSLAVEVSPSSENRETVVTMTATSPEGATQTKTLNVRQRSIGNYAMFTGTCTLVSKCTYPSAPSYNYTNKNSLDLFLGLVRFGGDTYLSLALPLSGIAFANWKVSNERPAGSMLVDGYTLVNFDCSFGNTQISIDGTTRGENESTNEFTVKIDLSSLTVKILESSKSEGVGYPGMSKPVPYKAQETLSGTLYYAEEYNQD